MLKSYIWAVLMRVDVTYLRVKVWRLLRLIYPTEIISRLWIGTV